MSGLEKITEHIISKANKKAFENTEKAKKEADTISQNAKAEAEKMREELQKRITADCEKIMQMSDAGDKQTKRQILLKAKSDIIKSIIEDAKNTVKTMDTEKYTEIIKTILKNSVTDKCGEILFSAKDKKIVDDDFLKYVKEISNNQLTVSEEAADIDSGFIIRYGKIEQNCSVDSIFEDKYNMLSDLVNEYLSAN